MSETDIIDFAYLVEQIFVCPFESYQSELLVSLDNAVIATKGIEYVEAVQAAHYFKQVSQKVFAETQFPGAINRASFGVSLGANYSMPFKEWDMGMEQSLFIRHDMTMKCQNTGYPIPISTFRRAKPRLANYVSKKSGTPEAYEETYLFQKYHLGKHFFSVRHSQKVTDGTMGPRQDEPYHLVFEVRTDGKPHKDTWSRLYSIGGIQNWNEGRSLAIRMEWEYPPKSGNWRHRYLFAHKIYTFADRNNVGSHVNYIKTIAMVQWLFNAKPNNPRLWMPRLKGCAYVLQTVYNYHTQAIEVKLQEPHEMRSGRLKTKANIIAAMQALGLDNVDGPFGLNAKCDGYATLSTKALASIGSDCVQIPGKNCCVNCMLFGRPCCSWTKNGAIRGMRAFTKGMIAGEIAHEGKVTSADVELNSKYRAGLHRQALSERQTKFHEFRQQLIDVVNLAEQEDDISDVEEAEEEFEGDDEDDED